MLGELNYLIVKRIFGLIVSRLNRAVRRKLKIKKRITVDRFDNNYSRKKSLKRATVEGANIIADFTCTLGTAQKQTKKRHRVVEFTGSEGQIVRVVTNLRDVTAEEIAGISTSCPSKPLLIEVSLFNERIE